MTLRVKVFGAGGRMSATVCGAVKADAGLEHLARRLPGAEPGELDLSGDLAEGVVDVPLELVLGNADRQLDELLVGDHPLVGGGDLSYPEEVR